MCVWSWMNFRKNDHPSSSNNSSERHHQPSRIIRSPHPLYSINDNAFATNIQKQAIFSHCIVEKRITDFRHIHTHVYTHTHTSPHYVYCSNSSIIIANLASARQHGSHAQYSTRGFPNKIPNGNRSRKVTVGRRQPFGSSTA